MNKTLATVLSLPFTVSALGAGNEPAPQSNQENTAPITCTVRLNRFHTDDNAPIDARYIGSEYESQLSRTGPNASRLFPSPSLSGITYTQTNTLPNIKNIFWGRKEMEPDSFTSSFLTESSIEKRLMPDGRYRLAFGTTGPATGVLHIDPNMNWSESFETSLTDPEKCLFIRKALVTHPPEYKNLFGFLSYFPTHTSDSYAELVWSITGKPTDDKALKADPAIRHIDRATRLKNEPVVIPEPLPAPYDPSP